MKSVFYKQKNKAAGSAQAIVEFAIALPILLVVIIGLLEVGRMVFIYSSVNNASRNAARYASAFGLDESLESGDSLHYRKYLYCDGIKAAAMQSVFLVNPADLEITVDYYDENRNYVTGCDKDETVGGELFVTDVTPKITSGYVVTVTVKTEYRPMVTLLPIDPRDIVSTNSRTILGIIDIK